MKTMLTDARFDLACVVARKTAQARLTEAFKKVGTPFEKSYAKQLDDYSKVTLQCLRKILYTQEDQK